MDYRRALTIFNKLYSYTIEPLYSRHKAGYTLLELLVSIGIIIILAAATVPGLGSKKTVNELNDVALDFQSKLKQAQSYAISPPTDNQGASAYGVKIVDESGKIYYSIVRLRNGNAENYPLNSNGLTSLPVKIIGASPPGVKIIWYKIGTTIIIETDTTSDPIGDITFIFGLRNGDTAEIRKVTINKTTGTINAT